MGPPIPLMLLLMMCARAGCRPRRPVPLCGSVVYAIFSLLAVERWHLVVPPGEGVVQARIGRPGSVAHRAQNPGALSVRGVTSVIDIGIDVGGTFTDFVLLHEDGHGDVRKVPTDPD